MTKTTLQIVSIVAAVALVGALSVTVTTKGDDSENKGGGFLRHLHGMAHHTHGGAHHQDPMAKVINQLELTPDQQGRLEKIHEIIGNYDHGESAMAELHEQLVAQFEQGQLESGEIRRVVDGHVEQMRDVGYAVTDELIALINGLDAEQRQVLSEHLQGR